MSEKILIRKTYSIYAGEMHFATMIFPYVNKEIKKGNIIKPILEKSISENIYKIMSSIQINLDLKKKIYDLDWEETNIEKIKKILKDMEELKVYSKNVNIIVSGSNKFIDKINELIDIWANVNFNNLKKDSKIINIINCYSFEENREDEILKNKHEYILNTLGVEEIKKSEVLKKAN